MPTCVAQAALHIHDTAFANVMRAPVSFFDTTPLGRVLNRFSRDQDVIDNVIPETIRVNLTLIIAIVACFVVISTVLPLFLIALVPIVLLFYRTQGFYRSSSREFKRLDALARSPLYAHFSETLTGLPTIRAYQEQDRFITGNEMRLDQNNQALYLQLQAQRWLNLRLDFTGAVIVGAAAFISVLTASRTPTALAGLSMSYALSVRISAHYQLHIIHRICGVSSLFLSLSLSFSLFLSL